VIEHELLRSAQEKYDHDDDDDQQDDAATYVHLSLLLAYAWVVPGAWAD
jgi:hypothetical protein